MEPYYAGWLSLLPPVIAITLALLTKEVISSLLIGILTGTFIYSVGMNSDVLFMGTIESAFDTMANLQHPGFLYAAWGFGLHHFHGGGDESVREMGYAQDQEPKGRPAVHRRSGCVHFHR